MSEVYATLKENGIEVLSMTHRELTIEEAFYIRDRNSKEAAKAAAIKRGDYFQNVNSLNQLRIDGAIDALSLNSMSQKNIGTIEKNAQIRERDTRVKQEQAARMTITGGKNESSVRQDSQAS